MTDEIKKKADDIVKTQLDGYLGKKEEPKPSYYGGGYYRGGGSSYGYGRRRVWGDDDYYTPSGKGSSSWDDDDIWEGYTREKRTSPDNSTRHSSFDWNQGDDMPEFLKRGRSAGAVETPKRDDLMLWKRNSQMLAAAGKLVVSSIRFEILVDALVREMNNAMEAAGIVWKGEAQSQNLRRQIEAMVAEDVDFRNADGEVFEIQTVAPKKGGE